MPQRPSPTRASSGGTSKDISPWLAMLGALTGTSMATGGPTGDTTAVNGTNASYATPEAMLANGGTSSNGTGVNPLVTPKPTVVGTGGFTPYKASTWANIVSRGQAGMQANQLNAGIYQQQLSDAASLERGKVIQGLANQGQLDVTKLTGQNAKDLALITGQQQRQTQAASADNALLTGQGLPTSRLGDYNTSVAPGILDLSKQRTANEAQLAGLDNTIQAKPEFAQNRQAGMLATQFKPYVANAAMGARVGQGDAAFANPIAGVNQGYFGSLPGGMTKTTEFNPQTLQSTETTTMTRPSPASMFSINPATGKPNIGNPFAVGINRNGGAALSSGEDVIKAQGNGIDVSGVVNPVHGASGSWQDNATVLPKPIMYGPPAPYSLDSNSQGLNTLINTLANGNGQTNNFGSNSQLLNNLLSLFGSRKQ